MAVCLLSSFINTTPSSKGKIAATNSVLSEIGWILNSLSRCWHALHLEIVHHGQSAMSSAVHFLDSLRLLCARMIVSQCLHTASAMQTRLAVLFAEVVAAFFRDVPLPLVAAVERALCLSFIEIKASIEKSQEVRQSFVEHLLPSVLSATVEKTRFDNFGPDLKVRLNGFVRSFH